MRSSFRSSGNTVRLLGASCNFGSAVATGPRKSTTCLPRPSRPGSSSGPQPAMRPGSQRLGTELGTALGIREVVWILFLGIGGNVWILFASRCKQHSQYTSYTYIYCLHV